MTKTSTKSKSVPAFGKLFTLTTELKGVGPARFLDLKGAMKQVNVVLAAGEASSDGVGEPAMWSRSEGNPHAVALLHIRHWKAAVAFAFSLTRDINDAEDLASHSFIKVISAINSGKGPTGPFRPYLFRAIRSSVADHWRRRSHEFCVDELPDKAHEEEGFAWVEAIQERERVSKAFSSLPLTWQKVIWHIDVVGLRPRQLAPMLGIGPNAVSALLRRARNGLREAYLRTSTPGQEKPLQPKTHPRPVNQAVRSVNHTLRPVNHRSRSSTEWVRRTMPA